MQWLLFLLDTVTSLDTGHLHPVVIPELRRITDEGRHLHGAICAKIYLSQIWPRSNGGTKEEYGIPPKGLMKKAGE